MRRPLAHVGDGRKQLALVLLTLLALSAMPFLTQRRIDRLRVDISAGADPALGRLATITTEVALEAAARRGYLLTGDQKIASSVTASRVRRVIATRELEQYARVLGRSVDAKRADFTSRLAKVDTELDSLFAQGVSREDYAVGIDDREVRFADALAAGDSLRSAIIAAADTRRAGIQSAVRMGYALTGALVLLGLAAAVAAARLASGLRTAALALDESESRFRQIAENVTDMVWLADPLTGEFLYVNHAYERIWGRPRAQLLSETSAMIEGIHPDDRASARAAIMGGTEGLVEAEFRVVRPDGTTRWVAGGGFGVHDQLGRVYRVAGIAEDVTERRAHALEREQLLERERSAREAAEARRKQLERVTESRTRLIRGFTHDVKNPLGAADGHLALLEEGIRGALAAPQQEAIGKARRSIRVALDLIMQLLDLARAETGQIAMRRDSFDVRDAVREVTEEFMASAEAKRLAFAVELPDGLPTIVSDANRVRQVVSNLVSNAVKYTPEGGRVTVRTLTRENAAAGGPSVWVVVEVVDTGRGISPEEQGMLFQEFTRFDPTAAEGSGIGLAISERLARALGGCIKVESAVGAGSRFALWLPRSTMGASDRRAGIAV